MTGSGKSVFVNGLIREMITKYEDEDVCLLLIDPKRVEFSRYKGVPHVLDKPAYSIDHIRYLLNWAVGEMHLRFTTMEKWNHRDIDRHNDWAQDVGDGKTWSRIVIIVDELANLILSDKKLEKPIVTIASMGRAAGIHLVLATQRPSADVVTGLIRANVPTRVCLPVVTKMESRIILDETGAERLHGPGDMLARLPGHRSLMPLRGMYWSDKELDAAVTEAMG